MDEVVKYLRALTYLQALQLLGESFEGKPEVVLHRAGLSHEEIASLLQKSPAAVQKAISREKLKSRSK